STLKRNYDGYHFDRRKSSGIYNPFSVLNTLSKRTYGSYWFNTGTPTYLVELIKKADFNIEELSDYVASEDQLNSIHVDDIDPIPVLYQSGYLTIADYDKEFDLFTLNYPNEEVKAGFINFLLPFYSKVKDKQAQAIISKFVTTVRSGKADDFMRQLQSLMAGIPYEIIKDTENHYQNVMYIITKLMGLYVQAEYRTSHGRIDLLIGTSEYVYIIELKFEGSAEDALAQIDEKQYTLPFAVDNRKIVKIGANVSKETRNIEKWIIKE
ncbi:MAG: PD-(D/E)XK nuclease domain-containing protein, partial [Bacteroidaceae bacterium]|nr:PD-(D/E)XK nuclease domain-containing protein [Bacteroidaceae bacterium]